MLSQGVQLPIFGCPTGACREQARTPPRTSWRALAASFAAGALAVSAFVALADNAPARQATPAELARAEAAVKWAAYVQAQTPRELPPAWRWEIKPVRVDGMYRKPR